MAERTSWEDIRQQTAVSANTGAGPDIVLGWAEDPHVYSDKLIELSDVAEYLGKKYGGWMFLGEKYGKKDKTNNWIGLPFGGSTGPIVYRMSALKEAGFDKVPSSHPDFLKLCQGLKAKGTPPGFALGNATGDANTWVHWLIWAHGGKMVDKKGNVVVTLTTDPSAIVVPSAAVQTSQQGPFVFVIKADQTVDLRPVTVARSNGTESVIKNGLQPGETVVTDGQLRLVPGSRVSIKSAGAGKVAS